MGNSTSSLPTTCHRIMLTKPHEDPCLADLVNEERPMPVPKSGEVLIRVVASPVNPSDYGGLMPSNPRGAPAAATTAVFEPKALGLEGS